MKCELCNSNMERQVAFLKCTNKQCRNSTYGIRKSDVKQVKGVDHLLVKPK